MENYKFLIWFMHRHLNLRSLWVYALITQTAPFTLTTVIIMLSKTLLQE